MNIQRLQGLALILSALIRALLLLPFIQYAQTDNYIFNVIEVIRIVSALLFIVGLSAIKTIQPQTKKSWGFRTRKWWLTGLVLMALPSVREIISGLNIIFSNDSGQLNSLGSSILGVLSFPWIAYSGYLLIGWLTTQTRVFPIWLGWILIITGIYNTVFLLLLFYASTPIHLIGFPGILMESVALAGYGWIIFNHQPVYQAKRAKAVP